MLENMMAKLGQGAAEVELLLAKDTFRAGEHIRGELVVTGGKVEQTIDGITVSLVRSMDTMTFGEAREVEEIQAVFDTFTIAAHSTHNFLFDYTLPLHVTPTDSETDTYYFVTKMKIDGALNNHDKKKIRIVTDEALHEIPTQDKPAAADPLNTPLDPLNQPLNPFGRRPL